MDAEEWVRLHSAVTSKIQRLWEKRDVKSARALATAIFLSTPKHRTITSVVMAVTQASAGHISAVQTELTIS